MTGQIRNMQELEDMSIAEINGALKVLDAGRVQPYGYVKANRAAALKLRQILADIVARKESSK